MPLDRFLIAPLNTGLQNNLRPWLVPDDAFLQLNNAYVFRGRVRKRFGSRFMGSGWSSGLTEPLFSRLRINLGNTDGSGNISGTVPGTITVGRTGQMFSVGGEIFTVYQTGTPADMYTTGSSTVHTYNTTSGAYVINGAAATTPLYYYPALPVMGFTLYEVGPVNDQPTYGFDTNFAYLFTGGSWQRSGTALWHGTNLNFVWCCNYRGATPNVIVLFATNFNATVPTPAATDDPIWWTVDGTNWTAGTGANAFYFAPAGGAPQTGPYVKTARIIVQFKNRLLLLNTVENDGSAGDGVNSAYVNKCRYSFVGSPFAVNAWYEPNQTDSSGNVFGGAGAIYAPTQEAIISVEFIKDRLIVFFERSTWEIIYTGNQVYPFNFQKINTELGSESTFSTVPFDKVILTIGATGVHACNGSNVERIDDKIPDEIWQFQDAEIGVERVFGIRDYYVEMVYWTFPYIGQEASAVYPGKVLVYNYKNGSWALNDDCITAFGYYEQETAETWSSTTTEWEENNQAWVSATVAAEFRQVIGGNQQGYTFIVDPDFGRNASAMQITNLVQSGVSSVATLTIIDHTLNRGDYITVENAQGVTLVSSDTYLPAMIFQVAYVNANTVAILAKVTGTYKGGGTAARVSNIQVLSKQWNPYDKDGYNLHLAKIDFAVQKTQNGQITVDYYPSSTSLSMIQDGTATKTIMGNNILETTPYDPIYYPLEQVQERLWHTIYFQSVGESIQINMSFSDAQITNPDIAFEDFELEGLILYTQRSSARLE